MAARKLDYSKWDKIELSDDESDCHPNIDKDSWFRLKHRTRLEREEREDVEIKEFEKLNSENRSRLNIIKARLAGIQGGQADEDAQFEDVDALQGEASELEAAIAGRNARIKDIGERRAWNIDNICKIKDEKTIVNKVEAASLRAQDFAPTGQTEAVMSENIKAKVAATAAVNAAIASPVYEEEEAAAIRPPAPPIAPQAPSAPMVESAPKVTSGPQPSKDKERFSAMSYNDYALANQGILETYSEIQDMEATKEFLFKHCDVLMHEHSQSYMLLSCLEDEMNGKRERMKLVARQSQVLSHIQELGVSMRRDPRDVILAFFHRVQESHFTKEFAKAVEDFSQKIMKRAVDKRREMDLDSKESAPKLGPGGLDPFEVLEILPQPMKDAFESQNIERLHGVIAEMDPQDAKRYMKLCVDSGLWVSQDKHEFD